MTTPYGNAPAGGNSTGRDEAGQFCNLYSTPLAALPQRVGAEDPTCRAAEWGRGINLLVFTRFRSQNPPTLTKRFALDADGNLSKTSSAQMTAGTACHEHVADLGAFAALLDALQPSEALAYGVAPGFPQARVLSQKLHREGDGAITRTRCYFQFAPGPGILMLDHDPAPGRDALSPEALIAALVEAAPCLRNAPMLWRPSVSSGICAEDGRELTGVRGQRLYLAVANASLIPKAGAALDTLLWAAGQGFAVVGKAGQVLLRNLFDTSVYQSERLDFAAPPILGPGLTRKPPEHRLLGDPAAHFDLQRLIDLADGTLAAAAEKARKVASAGAAGEATTVRDAWIEETAANLASRTGIDVSAATLTLHRAATQRELTGDFRLLAENGQEVAVGELLDHPERWHGKRFADPLEPDYGNDRRIAWANLRSGGRPILYSHAHGGRRFRLIRPSARIKLVVGERPRVVDQLLDLARGQGELFDFGDGASLARINDDARIQPVTKDWLIDHLGRQAAFYSEKEKEHSDGSVELIEVPHDTPYWAAQAMIAKDGERRLPRLEAVITAPTLRRDGSTLIEPGYDAGSRLLLRTEAPDALYIPPHPTLDQARAALAELWAPVELFPLVDSVDRGVVLAGLLTACLRASLPTAPGFGFDAPTAGSGKTLLAQAIGALTLGKEPAALPPAGCQDEEARKRLFSALRDGNRVLLWDNVREPLGNAALDAFLTAPQFADRILGKSEMAELPNRALFLATGNNLRLVGDTCRRILVARMDPQMEQPYARTFDFCPLQTALGRRLRLVSAALAVIRAWITAGRPHLGKGKTASFESWDELVRQPICWVSTWDSRFEDPLKATERAFSSDPETNKLSALLGAWYEVAKDGVRTVAQMRVEAATVTLEGVPIYPALVDALEEIAGDNRGNINPRILGRWIERNAERRVSGLRFVRAEKSGNAVRWSVQKDKSDRVKNNSKNSRNSKNHEAQRSSFGVSVVSGIFSDPPRSGGSHIEDFQFQEPPQHEEPPAPTAPPVAVVAVGELGTDCAAPDWREMQKRDPGFKLTCGEDGRVLDAEPPEWVTAKNEAARLTNAKRAKLQPPPMPVAGDEEYF